MAVDLQAGEFYGQTTSERIAGVVLSIVRHDRERRLPSHTHALPFLCLLLEGRYEEEAAGHFVRYEPLTLVFHPQRLSHSDHVYPDTRMFTVELGETWDDALAPYAPSEHSLYTHTGAEPLWIMLRLYEELRERTLSEITVQTLVYELIGSFDRLETAEDTASQPWLRALRALLDERYREPLDIREVAREVGVHPVHLTRTFRRAYKVNAGDYVHRRRIQHACRMLRESQISISAIAEELGYSDQSHFSRVFRSITGKTPARYRLSNVTAP
jgi:AraC family transcriptional regulator